MVSMKHISLILLFILGILIIIFFAFNYFQNKIVVSDEKDFVLLQKKYPHLSERTLRGIPQDVIVNFLNLRRQLKSEVVPYGQNFAFYFEYLPTGTSIGVNEKEEFHSASLFKPSVIMAYYHTKDRLNKKDDPTVTIKTEDLDSQFGTLWEKGVGYKIKLSEAIRLALEESNNTAIRLVIPFIEEEDFQAVYQGLDIDFNLNGQGAIITTESFASVLKALYFSAVLSKDSSNEILDYLTKTNFPDKLVAGVPPNVSVAHKIGDFIDTEGNQAFTDCGIVYYPKRTYILCMLSISDEQTARERMQDVSKIIYDYISSINPLAKVN